MSDNLTKQVSNPAADSAAYPNTYIGMRYVPIIVGEWDTTMQTEYEPLTIVTYQGNSYTSRTFVPKNINITNTEYWVLSANYNAQVEAYRQEVDALQTMVENNTQSTNVLVEYSKKLPTTPGSTIVTVGEKGCMYTRITEALDYAKTLTNKAVDILIFRKSSSYLEQVDLRDTTNINLFGIGMPEVSTTLTYPDSPLMANGTHKIQNMIFTAYRPETGNQSYAFHYEEQVHNVASNIEFFNCRFRAQGGPSIGCGLSTKSNLIFYNCQFEAFSSSGAIIYLHNKPGSATDQTVNFQNCTITGTSPIDVRIDDAYATGSSPMQVTFANTMTSRPNGILSFYDYSTTTSFIHGNNITIPYSKNNSIRGLNYTQDGMYLGKFTLTMQVPYIFSAACIPFDFPTLYNLVSARQDNEDVANPTWDVYGTDGHYQGIVGGLRTASTITMTALTLSFELK